MTQQLPHASLVLTGDELLRGFVRDANGIFLARALRRIGIDLRDIRVCGDDFDELTGALAHAQASSDIVIVSGGLGPTHDDRTAEAVAAQSGRALELDSNALAAVDARIGLLRAGKGDAARFAQSNRKQASVPRGSFVLAPAGTAPGFIVPGAPLFIVLPGPPTELQHAWAQVETSAILRDLLADSAARRERLVRVWGVPESQGADALATLKHEDSDAVRVTLCARNGELELSIRGADSDAVDRLTEQLVTSLAGTVFALDDERPIAKIVLDQLRTRSLTLAVAESCTGGLLGSQLSAHPGASDVFVGGAITYSNDVKTRLTGVSEDLLQAHGAVSEEVASAMARGARAATGANVALAISGIAGPGGGSPEKPVGLVWIAADVAGTLRTKRLQLHTDREGVRIRSCGAVLHLVREMLT